MIFDRTCCVWVAYALLFSVPTLAVADSQQFDIPAEALPSALKAFAAQAHIQVFYVHSEVANARSYAVRGELDTCEALQDLLRDALCDT